MNNVNQDIREPFFTRMRRDAETLLQRELSYEEAAEMAGVNKRSWQRFEQGEQVPSVATIRHFWVQANREHCEVTSEYEVTVAEFFLAVDHCVETWTPKMRRGS